MFPSVFEFELNIVNNICFKEERCFRIILNLSGRRIENKIKNSWMFAQCLNIKPSQDFMILP